MSYANLTSITLLRNSSAQAARVATVKNHFSKTKPTGVSKFTDDCLIPVWFIAYSNAMCDVDWVETNTRVLIGAIGEDQVLALASAPELPKTWAIGDVLDALRKVEALPECKFGTKAVTLEARLGALARFLGVEEPKLLLEGFVQVAKPAAAALPEATVSDLPDPVSVQQPVEQPADQATLTLPTFLLKLADDHTFYTRDLEVLNPWLERDMTLADLCGLNVRVVPISFDASTNTLTIDHPDAF